MIKGALTGLGGMGGGSPSDTGYNQSIYIKGAGGAPVKLPTGLMGPEMPPPTSTTSEDEVDGVPGLGPWPKTSNPITAAQYPQLVQWTKAMTWAQWRQSAIQYAYQLYDKFGKITNPQADMEWIKDFADQSFTKYPVKGGVGDSKEILIKGKDGDQKLYYAIVEKMMGGAGGHLPNSELSSDKKGGTDGAPGGGPLGLSWLWWGIAGGLGVYFAFGKKKKKSK